MDDHLIQATDDIDAHPDAPVTPDTATVSEPRKKRGRKPAQRDADGNIIRPDATVDVSPPARKTRGKKAPVDTAALANTLMGIHAVIAKLPGCASLALTPDECAILAPALQTAGEQYDMTVSPKTAATIQLLGVVAVIYGPRIAVMVENAKKRRTPPALLGGGDGSSADVSGADSGAD